MIFFLTDLRKRPIELTFSRDAQRSASRIVQSNESAPLRVAAKRSIHETLLHRRFLCRIVCGATLLFCLRVQSARAQAPTTAPVVDTAAIDAALGKTGKTDDGVYSIEVPRKDLRLTIDGADVPTAAGIASHFYFYTCPCGKTRVIGEFVVCDYESDDVVDALHEGWLIKIDAISPMLNDEKPRLRIVRFHGEGSADAIASHIRNALNQTGDARTK